MNGHPDGDGCPSRPATNVKLVITVETVHLAAMVLLVGSISAFDLRLLGLILRQERVSQLARRLLPFTWSAFAAMVVTGILLFGSDPVQVLSQPLVSH